MGATAVKLRPLGDRVVIQPVKREEVTKSGIVLPDTAQEKPQRGIVVAKGKGRKLDDGSMVEIDLNEGDEVLFAKYAGTEFKVEEEEYLVISEKDILAVVAP
jgi:chaperonin GroES